MLVNFIEDGGYDRSWKQVPGLGEKRRKRVHGWEAVCTEA